MLHLRLGSEPLPILVPRFTFWSVHDTKWAEVQACCPRAQSLWPQYALPLQKRSPPPPPTTPCLAPWLNGEASWVPSGG